MSFEKSSLGFFPTPYPDEILYSVLCRYHVRGGNACIMMVNGVSNSAKIKEHDETWYYANGKERTVKISLTCPAYSTPQTVRFRVTSDYHTSSGLIDNSSYTVNSQL